MKSWNWPIILVAFLSALSGIAAALVSMWSLTDLAQTKLGFPPGLYWALTASADVGAAAGAVMWTVSPPRTPARRTGVALNVCCLTVSALGVAADHSFHAYEQAGPGGWQGWVILAFAVGMFLPMLASWQVHGVAKMRWPEPAKARHSKHQEPAAVAAPDTPMVDADFDSPNPPVLVSLTKDEEEHPPTEIAQRRTTSGNATDWARQEWDRTNGALTARDVMDATGVAKGSAHRIINRVREEKTGS